MAARYKAYSRSKVSVSQSRDKINQLLREWDSNQIRWADDFDRNVFILEFFWKWEDVTFQARTTVFLEAKSDGRTEHRVLFNYLKACFTAVESGLMEPGQVFLPMLVGPDGRTVGEVMLPRLRELETGDLLQLGTG